MSHGSFFLPTRRKECPTAGDLSDAELEQHIDDSHWLYRTAYERFLTNNNPHDRDEALAHLRRMNQALLARSAAVQAARHAAFEQRITEGVDYFQSRHAIELGQQFRRAA
jgi:DNA-binding GntR family transcriptional regulator